MAVTSIDLDPELLAQVKKIIGVKSTKEAVTLSMAKVVQIERQLELIERASAPEITEILSHMHETAEIASVS